MAHIVIEYSANLRGQFDLDGFLRAVHGAALATGVFPIGGIRTRAYAAEHYVIADANPDNAFVHISLRVGHGRDVETRKRACEAIFAVACQQLGAVFERLAAGDCAGDAGDRPGAHVQEKQPARVCETARGTAGG